MRHLAGRFCWSLNRVPNCTISGCGKSHHEMLHEAIGEYERVAEVGGGGGVGHAIGDSSSQPETRVAGFTGLVYNFLPIFC